MSNWFENVNERIEEIMARENKLILNIYIIYNGGYHEPKKVKFTDYLTDLEGSSCELLEDWDFNLMPFKWKTKDWGKNISVPEWELSGDLPKGMHFEDGRIWGIPEEDFVIEVETVRKGVDLDRFKQECEEIDNE